jgi:integrase
VQYKRGAQNRRVVPGAVTALDLGKARSAARDIPAKVRLGQDPAGERIEQRRKVVGTFAALLPRFLDRQRGRLKPRSFVETHRHLTAHAKPLHGLAVEKIDRRAIAILIGKIAGQSGPFAANRVRASLSTYFTWLAREGIIGSSPTTFTNKAVESAPRDLVLSDDELASIWRAPDDSPYSAIVRLLMLTGARREEIGGLCWSGSTSTRL